MATINPAIVVIKAIEIPPEKIVGSPKPFIDIASKDLNTPYTVPKSPNNGANAAIFLI